MQWFLLGAVRAAGCLRAIFAALLLLLFLETSAFSAAPAPMIFRGMCDASAAVQLEGDLFAVASDEDNVLQFYRLGRPGESVGSYDLRPFLFGAKKAPESDLEAAARIGRRVYWITSHGRNAAGEPAPSRQRFFALEIRPPAAPGGLPALQPVGVVCTNFLAALLAEPSLAPFNLAAAASRAPKAAGSSANPGGLNIEAMTDTPEGALLIGFRNPIPQGKALIVPLLNPDEVILGQRPRFGAPILLDLGGLGLRGIGSAEGGYNLIAGPADREAQPQIYRWAGPGSVPQRVPGVLFPGINPEGICFHDDQGRADYVILSDDGTLNISGKDCKKLPKKQRQFRAFRLSR